MLVREMLDDVSEAALQQKTAARLIFAPDRKPLIAPPLSPAG